MMSLHTAAEPPQEDASISGTQRQQLVVTLFGLYGRRFDDYLPVADIIELLADLGMESAGVRSVISRLKRRGILVSGKSNNQAAYALAPAMEQVFVEGDQRIFNPQRANAADPWLLVSFSVPESKRNLRHQLRNVLGAFGFGSISSGLWIAPNHVEEAFLRELQRRDFTRFTKLFRANMIGEEDMSENIRLWWDLDSIAASYSQFIHRYSDPLTQQDCNQQAFSKHLALVTDWRRLPYLDPGLPLEFLPADWPGRIAEKLFLELHKQLQDAAAARAQTILGQAAGQTTSSSARQ